MYVRCEAFLRKGLLWSFALSLFQRNQDCVKSHFSLVGATFANGIPSEQVTFSIQFRPATKQDAYRSNKSFDTVAITS